MKVYLHHNRFAFPTSKGKVTVRRLICCYTACLNCYVLNIMLFHSPTVQDTTHNICWMSVSMCIGKLTSSNG